MSRKKTTVEVIAEFKAIHGDKYGYELVDYKGARIAVKIKCHEHGVFEQAPYSHKSGRGCNDCGFVTMGQLRRNTLAQTIADFKVTHGDRYGYELVEYVTTHKNVKIICHEHGVFEQTASGHKSGSGCLDCAADLKGKTQAQAIEGFKAVHGDRYGYELVDYVNGKTHVKIKCHEHGVFEKWPTNINEGQGCPDCMADSLRKYSDDERMMIGKIRRSIGGGLERTGTQKRHSTIKYLGCTLDEYKTFLEAQFEPWMNWENHGNYSAAQRTWHIDHIKPLAAFNHAKESQTLAAFHYTNTRPLCAVENLVKNAKWTAADEKNYTPLIL